MSDYLADTIKDVQAADEQRDRSQQTAIGWSDIGGCRAYLGFKLDEAWPSEEPDTWGPIRGTALHNELERSRAGRPGLLHNVTTVYRGIPGHADEVNTTDNSVTDWKTTKLGTSLVWRRDPEALLAKRVQVHGYAAGLIQAGVLTEEGCTVRILVAPVDGRFSDWWVHEEPFDRAIADLGPARLDEVKALRAKGEQPPRDMPWSWCQDWCEFFTVCRSGPAADEPITDPELAAAVEAYADANTRAGAADKEKKALAPLIRGLRGEARGYRVSLTEPSGTKQVLDEDEVRRIFEHNKLPVPTREVPTSTPSLRVVKVKKS